MHISPETPASKSLSNAIKTVNMDQFESHLQHATAHHVHLCIQKGATRLCRLVVNKLQEKDPLWYQHHFQGENWAHCLCRYPSVEMWLLMKDLLHNADESYRVNRNLRHCTELSEQGAYSRILWRESSQYLHETPLHLAARYGFEELVEWLLKEKLSLGVELNCASQPNLWTPLHEAIQAKQWDICKMLLQAGSNPNDLTMDGMSPMFLLANQTVTNIEDEEMSCEVSRWLLDYGSKADLPAHKGQMAIHAAVERGNTKLTKMMLALNSSFLNATDGHGLSTLHYCARGGHFQLLKFLLEQGAASDLKTSKNGELPVHIACFFGRHHCVSVLLKHTRTNRVFSRTSNGRTPLHMAALGGQFETVLTLLRDHSADLGLKDASGNTPEDLARDERTIETFRLFRKHCIPRDCNHFDKKELDNILNSIYKMTQQAEVSSQGMERSLDQIFEKVAQENRRRASILEDLGKLEKLKESKLSWDSFHSSVQFAFANQCQTLTHCAASSSPTAKQYLTARGDKIWNKDRHIWSISVEAWKGKTDQQQHLFVGLIEVSQQAQSMEESTSHFIGKDPVGFSWGIDIFTARKWHKGRNQSLGSGKKSLNYQKQSVVWLGLDMSTGTLTVQFNEEAPQVAFEGMQDTWKNLSAACTLTTEHQCVHLEGHQYDESLWKKHFEEIKETKPEPKLLLPPKAPTSSKSPRGRKKKSPRLAPRRNSIVHSKSPLRPRSTPRRRASSIGSTPKLVKRGTKKRSGAKSKLKQREPLHVEKRLLEHQKKALGEFRI